MLPATLTVLLDINTPVAIMLPPVTLPVTLTVVPLCTAPVLPIVAAEILAPVNCAPVLPIVAALTVAAVIVPVPDTTPDPNMTLPPVTLPLVLI